MTENEQQSPALYFNVSIPQGIPLVNFLEGKYNGYFLAGRAKRLGDRYRRLLSEAFSPEDDLFKDEEGFSIYYSLLGFACEIYAKSILYDIQGTSAAQPVEGHKLSLLCKRMPDTLQREMEDAFKKLAPDKVFDDELKKMDQFFTNLRYLYETNGYSLHMKTPRIILGILADCAERIINQE